MDTRETRDWAREAKFLIDAKLRPQVVEWSRANLEPDGHGSGVFADEYTTASLYLETDSFDVYQRRDSYGRSKFRIRRYGMLDFIFLERKFRTDRLLAKRRTTVPVTDLERLAANEPDPVLADLVRFLCLVPCRRQEAARIEFDDVHIDRREWRAPGNKTSLVSSTLLKLPACWKIRWNELSTSVTRVSALCSLVTTGGVLSGLAVSRAMPAG